MMLTSSQDKERYIVDSNNIKNNIQSFGLGVAVYSAAMAYFTGVSTACIAFVFVV